MLFNYLDEFLSVLEKYKVNKEDVCIAGSGSFAANGIFPNNDIDFFVKKRIRDTVFSHLHETSDLSDNVQLLFSEKYKGFFGITDDEIINNPRYHFEYKGIKVIKSELEYSARLIMRREKDLKSFPKIEEFIKDKNSWDYNLIKELRQRAKKQKIKRILRFIKNRITALKKVKVENAYGNILTGGFSHCVYPTEKFLNRQRDKNGYFQACDVVIRYGFVKEYLEKGLNSDNFWYQMYEKMQLKRGAISSHYAEHFASLADEYNKSGYDYDSEVLVARNGYLLDDGSHRTALNLVYNVPYTALNMSKVRKRTRNYGIDWFKKNGFSEEEIKQIEQLKYEIFMQKGIYFPVILWGSVTKYVDEIIEKHVSQYGKVVDIKKYSFEENEKFREMLFKIYSSDDIEDWKVEKKLEYLKPYKNEFTVLYVEIPNPKFRKKALNNHDISTVVEKMKKEIRTTYKEKIDNYFYDIVAHVCDNYAQNRIVNRVLKEADND